MVSKGKSLRWWERRPPGGRRNRDTSEGAERGSAHPHHPAPEPLPWSVIERMPRMSVTEWEEGQVRGMATEPGMAGTPGGVGTLAAAAVMGLGYE